jgi:hypothetical protein
MSEAIGLQQGFGNGLIMPSVFPRSFFYPLSESFPKARQQAPDINSLQDVSRISENLERRRETRGSVITEREVDSDIPVPAPKRTIEVIANFVIVGRGKMPPIDDDFVYFDE